MHGMLKIYEPYLPIPIPNVETSFFTNDNVCGVMLASETAPEFSKATA